MRKIIIIITMIIITIIIITIVITIIIMISRIVLNAYVLNIPPQTPLKSTKMQHRLTDRRTDIQFHETLKDLDPKDTYTSNFLNPHSLLLLCSRCVLCAEPSLTYASLMPTNPAPLLTCLHLLPAYRFL